MFDIIETTNDVGRRAFILRNLETGRDLGRFTYYDDALARQKQLITAHVRRLKERNATFARTSMLNARRED